VLGGVDNAGPTQEVANRACVRGLLDQDEIRDSSEEAESRSALGRVFHLHGRADEQRGGRMKPRGLRSSRIALSARTTRARSAAPRSMARLKQVSHVAMENRFHSSAASTAPRRTA